MYAKSYRDAMFFSVHDFLYLVLGELHHWADDLSKCLQMQQFPIITGVQVTDIWNQKGVQVWESCRTWAAAKHTAGQTDLCFLAQHVLIQDVLQVLKAAQHSKHQWEFSEHRPLTQYGAKHVGQRHTARDNIIVVVTLCLMSLEQTVWQHSW